MLGFGRGLLSATLVRLRSLRLVLGRISPSVSKSSASFAAPPPPAFGSSLGEVTPSPKSSTSSFAAPPPPEGVSFLGVAPAAFSLARASMIAAGRGTHFDDLELQFARFAFANLDRLGFGDLDDWRIAFTKLRLALIEQALAETKMRAGVGAHFIRFGVRELLRRIKQNREAKLVARTRGGRRGFADRERLPVPHTLGNEQPAPQSVFRCR